MLLHRWLDDWYALYVIPSGVRPSTLAMYRRAINALSGLPDFDLGTMTGETVLTLRRWLLRVAAAHPRAAQLDQLTLCRALAVAADLNLCPSGLIRKTTLPKIQHKAQAVQTLDEHQLAVYLAAAFAAEPEAAPLLSFCACGLRRSEALGVRWCDITDNHQRLAVTGQRLRSNGQYSRVDTKTAHSHRSLILPEWLTRQLIIYHQRHPRSLYVCDTTPEELRRAHLSALDWAGLPSAVTLHGLRHSYATIAAEHGAPMKALAVSLGHSTIKLTADLYADHMTTSNLPSLILPRPA